MPRVCGVFLLRGKMAPGIEIPLQGVGPRGNGPNDGRQLRVVQRAVGQPPDGQGYTVPDSQRARLASTGYFERALSTGTALCVRSGALPKVPAGADGEALQAQTGGLSRRVGSRG